MAREYLLKSFREVIENQLNDKNPMSTYETYQILLNKGFEEERIIQKLMVVIEDEIYDTLSKNEPFDENQWNQKMKELASIDYNDNKINDYRLRKIPSFCKKEFGSIPKGNEEPYEDGLFTIENNLCILASKYQLSGREIFKVIEIAISMLYASYHEETYNYEDVANEDIIHFAHVIAYNLNVYENEELKNDLLKENDVDLNDPIIRKSTFAMSIKCLVHVKQSAEYWMNKWGSEGYITYISTFLEA